MLDYYLKLNIVRTFYFEPNYINTMKLRCVALFNVLFDIELGEVCNY